MNLEAQYLVSGIMHIPDDKEKEVVTMLENGATPNDICNYFDNDFGFEYLHNTEKCVEVGELLPTDSATITLSHDDYDCIWSNLPLHAPYQMKKEDGRVWFTDNELGVWIAFERTHEGNEFVPTYYTIKGLGGMSYHVEENNAVEAIAAQMERELHLDLFIPE